MLDCSPKNQPLQTESTVYSRANLIEASVLYQMTLGNKRSCSVISSWKAAKIELAAKSHLDRDNEEMNVESNRVAAGITTVVFFVVSDFDRRCKTTG
jgi:hypothetical protein